MNWFFIFYLTWPWGHLNVLDTTLCDKVCQWLATCQWFSLPIKHDCHDIAEILLNMALNIINQPTIIWAVAMTWCPSYVNFTHLLWGTEPIQEPKFVVYVLWDFLQKYFISFLTLCKAWLPLEILQVSFMYRLNTKFWKLTCPL